MLEIILMVATGLAVKKMAEQKGRKPAWALLALAIPAVGWTFSLVAGIFIGIQTGTSNIMETPYFLPVVGITLAAEIATAAAVYFIAKSLKPLAPQQPAYPAAPPAA